MAREGGGTTTTLAVAVFPDPAVSEVTVTELVCRPGATALTFNEIAQG